MATNLPTTLTDLIPWASTHAEQWVTNAEEIGLTDAEATAFKALSTTLSAASIAAETARQASKDATRELNNSATAVRALAGAYIARIKGFADATDDEGVFALAGITPNDPRSTPPPPIPPQTFIANINGDGSLTIKWKVTQPAGANGVQYQVSRRMQGETSFTLVASEGSKKSYTDDTLPFGTDRVEYLIRPKRGDVFGVPSSIFTVQFGSVGAGGAMSILSTSASPGTGAMPMMKAAA